MSVTAAVGVADRFRGDERMELDDSTGGLREYEAVVERMRSDLTARLDAEGLLAQASAARQAAVVDADAILAEAQRVAEELFADSRQEVERIAARAQLEAAAVLTRARSDADFVRAQIHSEAEEHRRRVREEVSAQVTRELADQAEADRLAAQERSESMIDDLATSVRILGVSLETAQTNIVEMLASLEALRAQGGDSSTPAGEHGPIPEPASAPEGIGGEVEGAAAPLDPDGLPAAPVTPAAPVSTVAPVSTDTAGVDEEAGWAAPYEAVPVVSDHRTWGSDRRSSENSDDDERTGAVTIDDESLAPAGDERTEPPQTALAAFLSSAHLDHGDPPLAHHDDADEVVARYALDAQRGRPGSEAPDADLGAQLAADLGEDPETQADDGAGSGQDEEGRAPERPLSWLFRSTP